MPRMSEHVEAPQPFSKIRFQLRERSVTRSKLLITMAGGSMRSMADDRKPGSPSGGIDQSKEPHRSAQTFHWLDDARRDATYPLQDVPTPLQSPRPRPRYRSRSASGSMPRLLPSSIGCGSALCHLRLPAKNWSVSWPPACTIRPTPAPHGQTLRPVHDLRGRSSLRESARRLQGLHAGSRRRRR